MRSGEWPHPRSPLPDGGEGDFLCRLGLPGHGREGSLSPGLYIKGARGAPIKN